MCRRNIYVLMDFLVSEFSFLRSFILGGECQRRVNVEKGRTETDKSGNKLYYLPSLVLSLREERLFH